MGGLLSQLKDLVDYVDTLKQSLIYAKIHLERHLKDMNVEELQCLLMDDVFTLEEYPIVIVGRIAEGGDVYKDKAKKLLTDPPNERTIHTHRRGS